MSCVLSSANVAISVESHSVPLYCPLSPMPLLLILPFLYSERANAFSHPLQGPHSESSSERSQSRLCPPDSFNTVLRLSLKMLLKHVELRKDNQPYLNLLKNMTHPHLPINTLHILKIIEVLDG